MLLVGDAQGVTAWVKAPYGSLGCHWVEGCAMMGHVTGE
jgi:hypothetical protein